MAEDAERTGNLFLEEVIVDDAKDGQACNSSITKGTPA
jgi:hypothetical protein